MFPILFHFIVVIVFYCQEGVLRFWLPLWAESRAPSSMTQPDFYSLESKRHLTPDGLMIYALLPTARRPQLPRAESHELYLTRRVAPARQQQQQQLFDSAGLKVCGDLVLLCSQVMVWGNDNNNSNTFYFESSCYRQEQNKGKKRGSTMKT